MRDEGGSEMWGVPCERLSGYRNGRLVVSVGSPSGAGAALRGAAWESPERGLVQDVVAAGRAGRRRGFPGRRHQGRLPRRSASHPWSTR